MRGKSIAVGPTAKTWLTLPDQVFEWLGRHVESGHPAATLDRFFRSRHVKDLRALIVIALGAVLIVLVVGLPLSFQNELYELHTANEKAASTPTHAQSQVGNAVADTAVAPTPSEHSGWTDVLAAVGWFVLATLHVGFATFATFFTFFAPTLGVFGALVAWAYQTGSARLGVVDLFACEISTLCRVMTVVDAVTGMIQRLDTPGADAACAARSTSESASPARDFSSQEQYFPVFEGNTKDLQSLEARVVINITAFYTYMKTVRDSMRGRAPVQDVIYLVYLALESGRKAIEDLVEFEPEQAERIIVVLISELKAYGFLRERLNRARLKLREPEYRKLISELDKIVSAGESGPNRARWEPAALLLPEIHRRHADALAAAARATPIDPREVPSIAAALPASAAA